MPVPILPMNVRNDGEERNFGFETDYQGINIEVLDGIVKTHSENKNTKVSNSDASLLFRFWQEGKVVKKGNVESVHVPEKFSNNDILRLKALGFVVGDDTKVVKLTQRAKDIIKTIVLNEENQFDSTRISKPYNEILAEDRKNKSGGVRLALDDKK